MQACKKNDIGSEPIDLVHPKNKKFAEKYNGEGEVSTRNRLKGLSASKK